MKKFHALVSGPAAGLLFYFLFLQAPAFSLDFSATLHHGKKQNSLTIVSDRFGNTGTKIGNNTDPDYFRTLNTTKRSHSDRGQGRSPAQSSAFSQSIRMSVRGKSAPAITHPEKRNNTPLTYPYRI
jgi:hypothetical protein